MDAKTYLIRQFSRTRDLVEASLSGLTDAQLTWLPPGLANPIGLTALHMLAAEDHFISLLRGKEQLWQTQNWGATFNLAEPPGFGQDWTLLRHAALSVEKLLGYQVVIRVETDFFFDTLTNETLEAPVNLFNQTAQAADVLTLLIGHTLMHAGEIAALKGVYGVKGLPY